MTLIKKLLCAAMALMMILSLGLAQAEHLDSVKSSGKLIFATSPDYAPFEFLDGEGNVVGADVALAQHIAKELGVELQIEALDFDTVVASVATGKVDIAISAISPTEERKQSMLFSMGYHSEGDQVLLVLSKNADQYKALSDFDGKVVAAQNGSLQQTLVNDQLPAAKMEPILKIPDAIMMVMTEKVDALAVAYNVAEQYIKNYPELVVAEPKFDYQNDGEAVAIPLDSPALLEAVNAIVQEVVDSGLYLTWLDEAIQLSNSLN